MELVMRKEHWQTLAGVGIGLLGACTGLLLLAAWWHFQTGDSMQYFIQEVFWNGGLYQDSIVTVSVLADVLIFFGLMRVNKDAIARGVMVVVLAAVPVVIWLQMVNFESA